MVTRWSNVCFVLFYIKQHELQYCKKWSGGSFISGCICSLRVLDFYSCDWPMLNSVVVSLSGMFYVVFIVRIKLDCVFVPVLRRRDNPKIQNRWIISLVSKYVNALLPVELTKELLIWIQYLLLPFFITCKVISKDSPAQVQQCMKKKNRKKPSILFLLWNSWKIITYRHSPT